MFETYLVQPIYNIFIYLIGLMPYSDVGFAIIALTLLVRAVFYPAFASSIRTQMGMQAVQGDIDEINKTYKDNATERGKRTMELLKKNKIRPFSSILALLIQLPILFALYAAFFREGLPKIATQILYPFVPVPQAVNMEFLGVLHLGVNHNIFLTAIVAALQYGVMWFSVARIKKGAKNIAPEKEMVQKTQQQLMLYFFPILMGVVTYSLPGAVGLYFAATNLVSIGQELYISRQMKATV